MVRPTLPRFRRYEPPVSRSTQAPDLGPASCGSAHLAGRPETAPAPRDRSIIEPETREPEVIVTPVRDDEVAAGEVRDHAFIDLARIEREGFDRVVAPLPVRVPQASGHRFGQVEPVSARLPLGPTLQPTGPILRSGGSTLLWRSLLPARLRVQVRIRPPRWRKWKAKVRRRLRRPTTTQPLDRTALVVAVLSALATVASVAALVADTHVGPTRAFVATMAPLYRDPAVADRLSADLAHAVDPQGAMKPAQQADLRRTTHTLVMTPEFGALWEQSLRDARASTLTSTSLGGRDVVVLQAGYGAELRRLVGLVGSAATWLTVAAVGLVLAFLIRSSNRLRACSLLGATTAGAGAVAWLLGFIAVSMAVFDLPTTVMGMAIALVPWGLGCFACNSAQQARLGQTATALAPALMALNTSAIYLGQAIGAASGGLMVAAAGYAPLPLAGLGWLAAALALSLWATRRVARTPFHH